MSVADVAPAEFVVGPWSWDAHDGVLTCTYVLGEWSFAEEFRFGLGADLDEPLARAFDLLAVTAGVSYYKVAPAPTITVRAVAPSDGWHGYVTNLYDKGMREFRHQNGLSLEHVPTVVLGARPPTAAGRAGAPAGALVPMGGGRDSLLVALALRPMTPVLMTVGGNPVVDVQAASLGLPLRHVGRRLDPLLFDLNRRGALNGHVPVTAINSCLAVALAVLVGAADVVMSNERSASEPTRIVGGTAVNHQYSKSAEFEVVLRAMITLLDLPVRYFSVLRDLGEDDVSRLIGRHWDELPPFVSCNRARTAANASSFPTWCGTCAKCYFVFLALAPHVPRATLAAAFGRDLLSTDADVEAVEHLLLQPDRDFECIGTPYETRTALHAAAAGEWHDVAALRQLATRCAPAPQEDDFADVTAWPSAVPDEYRRMIEAL